MSDAEEGCLSTCFPNPRLGASPNKQVPLARWRPEIAVRIPDGVGCRSFSSAHPFRGRLWKRVIQGVFSSLKGYSPVTTSEAMIAGHCYSMVDPRTWPQWGITRGQGVWEWQCQAIRDFWFLLHLIRWFSDSEFLGLPFVIFI